MVLYQVALVIKNPPANAGGLIPGSGRFPWRRARQPTPVFLPREFHGQRILAGYIQSVGSHRVRHDWSNLACMQALDFSATLSLSYPLLPPLCSGEWIEKLCNVYTVDYYSVTKRNKSELVELRWTNLEPAIQSEVREKQVFYINAYIWSLGKWYWWTHLRGRNRDTENGLVDKVSFYSRFFIHSDATVE